MNRQARIKLLARSLTVLCLVLLTTAESCSDIQAGWDDLIRTLSQSSPEEQRTLAAGMATDEAYNRAGRLTMTAHAQSNLQTQTAQALSASSAPPTPTSTPTFPPLPSATATRTPAPSATSTATSTPTPPPPTGKYIDPMNDCSGYKDGAKKECPPGRDMTELTVTYNGTTLSLDVTLGGDVTQPVTVSLTVRYGTEPNAGKLVSDTITYKGIERGQWILFTSTATRCTQERGEVILTGQRCTTSNNGHRVQVQVPVNELAGATNPIVFRVFTTLYANSDPNIPIDSFPEVDKLLRLSPNNPNLPYHPLFNDVVWK